MYKICLSSYHRILQNKMTDTYKLDNRDTRLQINNNIVKFASKQHIQDG